MAKGARALLVFGVVCASMGGVFNIPGFLRRSRTGAPRNSFTIQSDFWARAAPVMWRVGLAAALVGVVLEVIRLA